MSVDASNKQRLTLGAAAIVALTCAVYTPVLDAGFVWDDDLHLTDNGFVQADDGLKTIWFSTDSYVYYPIAWSTLWLEHQLWGLNPAGYHVVNVLLHALCAVMVWRVLAWLPLRGAWAAAAIFAVHPVNVESAAWITQHKNTLSMFWMLVALWGYLRYDGGAPRRFFFISIGAFALAALSKGSVVPLPGVLLLLAWWRRGTISRADVKRSLPFWTIAICVCLIEVWFQVDNAAGHVVRDDSIVARLAGAGWVVWFYIYKAVWPAELIFVYPRWTIDAGHGLVWLPNAALLAVLIAAWRYRRFWGRAVMTALVYFIFMIVPAMGFADFYFLRYSFVADHYQYFSMPAVIALFVAALPRTGAVRTAAGVIAIVALSMLTVERCRKFHDEETLWKDTLAKNPQAWMAHNNLGSYLYKRDRRDEAAHHFKLAIAIYPQLPSANTNLGAIALTNGRAAEAAAYFKTALELRDDLPAAHYGLGFIAQRDEQFDQAMEHYRRALQYNPDHADANNNLGVLLMRQGDARQAADHLLRAVHAKPDSASAHANAAVALVQINRMRDAIEHAHAATSLTNRRNAAMLETLARVYMAAGEQQRAAAVIEHALTLPQATASPSRQATLRAILETAP